MNSTMLIKKPIQTEKSLKSLGSQTRYTFRVDLRATKSQIRQAIEQQFAVKVQSINTSVEKGKTKRRFRSRTAYPVAPTKKAMVTLAAGGRINALEVKG